VIRRIIFKLLKLAFILVLFLALLAGMAWFYPEKFLCVDSGKNVSADVIIVLGGGAKEQRAECAAELFKAHRASRILITGAGDDEINRQILLAHGVPANAIQLESESKTTHENAVYSLKILRAENVHSAILVTSWYHSRRTEKIFECFAPDIKFYSRPSYFGFAAADWKKTAVGRRMRLEFLKLPGYIIRYGMNPF
jgi:uncharacterized SAM-binding protein YcdF (DUF218 family)